jgi:hypothetical protein
VDRTVSETPRKRALVLAFLVLLSDLLPAALVIYLKAEEGSGRATLSRSASAARAPPARA